MSYENETSEMWKEYRRRRQQKRYENQVKAISRLNTEGVMFEEKNHGTHLIVEGPECYIDYWPTTGRWIVRNEDKTRGFGINKLLKYLKEGGAA